MDESTSSWFKDIVQELYNLDENAAAYGVDYELDLQGSTYSSSDNARRPLFEYFKEEELFSRPTYAAFIKLLDNYFSGIGQEEHVNKQEVHENQQFILAICKTPVIKRLYEELTEKGYFSGDYTRFKHFLYNLWFKLYSRNYESRMKDIVDSSAFEHTFVGETKDRPTGFHNWLRFYLLEKTGELDYKGHIRRANRSCMIQVKFNWEGSDKISSIFIGTSPEFEIAIYTISALMSQKFECSDLSLPFVLEDEEYKVQVYTKSKFSRKHNMKKYKLESAFPAVDFN